MIDAWTSPISTSILPDELIAQEPPAVARAVAAARARSRRPARVAHTRRSRDLPRLPARRRSARAQQHAGVSGAAARAVACRAAARSKCLLLRTLAPRTSRERSGVGGADASRAEAEAGSARACSSATACGCTARCWRGTSTAGGRSGCGPRTAATSRRRSIAIGHMPLPPYIKRDDRAVGSRAVSDGLRARARLDRGADRRPALHAGAARRRSRRAASSAPRSRCTSATARSSRCASSASRSTSSIRRRSPCRRGGRGADARAARGPPHHRRRHDDDARARVAGGRRRRHACEPGSGETRLFIHPGHEFRLVDGLITNFHLPRSSLLMLVAALRRPRARARRVPGGGRARLPLLQLRRRDADRLGSEAQASGSASQRP